MAKLKKTLQLISQSFRDVHKQPFLNCFALRGGYYFYCWNGRERYPFRKNLSEHKKIINIRINIHSSTNNNEYKYFRDCDSKKPIISIEMYFS